MGPGEDGEGRGRSKKSNLILAPPCDAGLKSCPILVPSPLRGGKNSCRAKRGGAVKWDEAKLPSLIRMPFG